MRTFKNKFFPLCQGTIFETQDLNEWLRILYYLSEKFSDDHASPFVSVGS